MRRILDVTNFSSVLVLDTQIILECQPITKLDWSEIDQNGPILLLALPTLLSEIDQFKRDGRLGKRARDFNRLVEPSVTSGKPAKVLAGCPELFVALAHTEHIDWADLSDLSNEDGDDLLVAQMIHAAVSDSEKLKMLSFDMRPRAGASRHGFAAIRPPEDWLLPKEPHPKEKELFRLREQVRLLKENSPALEFEIGLPPGRTFGAISLAALEEEDAEDLNRTILLANRRYQPHQFDLVHDYSYDGRYDRFAKRSQKFGQELHERLQTAFNQYQVELTIRNAGSVTAENIQISVESRGALVWDRIFLDQIRQPVAPVYRPHRLDVPDFAKNLPPARRDRHEVYFVSDAERPTHKLGIECEDFRQGRTAALTLFLTLDPAEREIHLKVQATAANMKGSCVETYNAAIDTEELRVEDVYDLKNRQLTRDVPLSDLISDNSATKRDDKVVFGN